MNKPFNSRVPLKNITRKEAMKQMEGGQDNLMNYPMTPNECVKAFMERGEIKVDTEEVKELFK